VLLLLKELRERMHETDIQEELEAVHIHMQAAMHSAIAAT
jgi:hypothetical protein